GELSTISDHKDNVHWFKCVSETGFIFNVHVTDYDKTLGGGSGRLSPDGEGGKIAHGPSKAPKRTSSAWHKQFGRHGARITFEASMPSAALQTWSSKRLMELNAAEAANRSWIRGRQDVAAQQLLRAFTLLLSSQFQGFCRDLHTECIDHLIRAVIP